MVVDSARGMTTSYVHVISGERVPGKHDQYWGIHSDTHREYINHTRGEYMCHVWLQEQPFGLLGKLRTLLKATLHKKAWNMLAEAMT